MYGKLFESMYDGTLVEDWRALITFQQMIVLCDPDGIVDITPAALSRRTGIPIEHIEKGIGILEGEDPYSRTPDSDGRRIVRLDDHRQWGWYIVNHKKYRDLVSHNDKRAKARERKRRQREREQQKPNEGGHADVHGCHASSRMSRHTDSDTDSDTDTDTDADAVHSRPPSSDRQGQEKGHCVTAHEGFDAFWKVYPKKRKKKAAREIWVRKKLSSMADRLVNDVVNRKQRDERWSGGFIPDPPTYLNQERWEDELCDTAGREIDSYSRQIDAAVAAMENEQC